MPLEEIRLRTESALAGPARTWLHQALDEAASAPRAATWELHFASAGRQCGGRAAATDARVLLLCAAGAEVATVVRLYHQGTAPERAAVLAALPYLGAGSDAGSDTDSGSGSGSLSGSDVDADPFLPLVEDALRAHDTTLVVAAVGPYAAARLPAHPWRQAVLKCLFTGVPLSAVAGFAERARGDAELARMLADYARERTAAGRSLPADLRGARQLAESAEELPRPEEPRPEEQ